MGSLKEKIKRVLDEKGEHAVMQAFRIVHARLNGKAS